MREKKIPLLELGSVQRFRCSPRAKSLKKGWKIWSLSLNFWLTKFVQEVADKTGGRYPPRSLYGTICELRRHLEDQGTSM